MHDEKYLYDNERTTFNDSHDVENIIIIDDDAEHDPRYYSVC